MNIVDTFSNRLKDAMEIRNMKQSEKHLEEMKQLVDYKDEDSEVEEEEELQKEETQKMI